MSNGSTGVESGIPEGLPSQENNEEGLSPTLHRSASHTQLQNARNITGTPEKASGIHRSFSENVLTDAAGKDSRGSFTKETLEGAVKLRRPSQRLTSTKSGLEKHRSATQYAVSRFMVGADEALQSVAQEPISFNDRPTSNAEIKQKSVSASITKFARKSWSSKSRSPSPSPRKTHSHKDKELAQEPGRGLRRPAERIEETENNLGKSSNSGLLRRNSTLSKKPRRPLSSLLSKKSDGQEPPLVPPIPTSFSTEKLPALIHTSSTFSNQPALPTSKSFEGLSSKGSDTPRKKDELWSVFRNLDGEYQKFQTRPSTLKTGIVRSALLPFLRSYAEHPSIFFLKPEDFDRRTIILNKWWTGLLEMLNGRHGESVSGNDRPAVLEAVTALMVRPEWDLPFRTTATRLAKTPRASLKSRSTTSLGSTMTMSSDFLAESIHHNVRNIFTQNLLAQMSYVVDKLSLRSVAASVVAFCGKATAYAFFYCEGVAEILVRLWAVPSSTIRRVLVENGIQKSTNLDAVSNRVCALFPSCLQSLTFRSLQPTLKYLRTRPRLPIATTYIPWHGPWIGRWAGQDTDLLYVFTKFYTDLACRFLPEVPSIEEKMAAPGWLLVQAQMLAVLDTTMQRASNQPQIEQQGSSLITFDEFFSEADANAAVLPLPTNGTVRSMAENRLILLLRDCLSGSTLMTERTQSIFADSFSSILKATARNTSVFDHSACFALCDFLEEALAILTRYHQSSDVALGAIDWSFWLDVCKRMLQSHNSMTEVRLCAFLYAMWPTMICDGSRKREICNEWLLKREVFVVHFNHWCPMVRAFFMRLLAWRIARLDGTDPDLDKSIMQTLSQRLQESWCYFRYMQEQAGKPPLGTPSSPAPGRLLVIIRNDIQPPTAGMFLSFDDILSSSRSKANPYEKHSAAGLQSQSNLTQAAETTNSLATGSDGGKRRWNLLKNILPNSSSTRDRTKSGPSNNQQEIAGWLRNKSQISLGDSESSGNKKTRTALTYRSLSFKFSLEWYDAKVDSAYTERRLYPPRLPPWADGKLVPRSDTTFRDMPLKPEGVAAGPSRYVGSALAEWSHVILECERFIEKRKVDGVPVHQMVETPTLGVEPFRK